MKVYAIGVASVLAAATGLGGCTPGDLQSQAGLDQDFSTMCSYLPAIGPVVTKLNLEIKKNYATAKTVCAAGTPTNPAIAGIDILSVYSALAPYFGNAQIKVPRRW
jgi:hypothetical protein